MWRPIDEGQHQVIVGPLRLLNIDRYRLLRLLSYHPTLPLHIFGDFIM
ncbi:hypothetical protein [Secundilactobacillus similis]|nr:hypothetical protein [Secundilactobacillus similis]